MGAAQSDFGFTGPRFSILPSASSSCHPQPWRRKMREPASAASGGATVCDSLVQVVRPENLSRMELQAHRLWRQRHQQNARCKVVATCSLSSETTGFERQKLAFSAALTLGLKLSATYAEDWHSCNRTKRGERMNRGLLIETTILVMLLAPGTRAVNGQESASQEQTCGIYRAKYIPVSDLAQAIDAFLADAPDAQAGERPVVIGEQLSNSLTRLFELCGS